MVQEYLAAFRTLGPGHQLQLNWSFWSQQALNIKLKGNLE